MSPHARRYPSKTVRFARALREKQYSYDAIVNALARQGVQGVSPATVWRWCNPDRAMEEDRRRSLARARARSSRDKRTRRRYLLSQAQRLIDAGLSYAATARALEVYEGDTLAPDTIRHYLGGGGHRHRPGLAGLARDNSRNFGAVSGERVAA